MMFRDCSLSSLSMMAVQSSKAVVEINPLTLNGSTWFGFFEPRKYINEGHIGPYLNGGNTTSETRRMTGQSR